VELTQREIAMAVVLIGVAMIGIGAWLQHRRQYRLMPSLVAPMPLMIFGAAVAIIAFIVVILPSR
jgi:hypothetical protein